MGQQTDSPLSKHLCLRLPRKKEQERGQLGFLRQPRVRWLSPPLLLKAGVEVAVSSTFGQFADRRELETAEQDSPFDYSAEPELWVDYLSDTGDSWEATYTMAWLLGRAELSVGGQEEKLPRGDVLLLGGDQVYPAPGVDGVAYEDRFVGPFSAAAPSGTPSHDLFALPGNHDWYDGLTSFLRIFCRPDWIEPKTIGDWRTRQKRSYWALRLPHDWWIWAIDIQLDTYIDNAQLAYFEQFRGELEKGGQRVILITAKPSWLKAEPGSFAPASWRNLAYFERRMIREAGGELALTLTGDLHHYSRYETEGATAGPARITAGGGGAYLSATHSLPDAIDLIPEQGAAPLRYRRVEIYPPEKASKRLSWGIFALPWHNPWFALVLGAIYALFAAAILGTLNAGEEGLISRAEEGDALTFLGNSVGGATIILAVLLGAILSVYADFRNRVVKVLAGNAHALLHVAAVGLLVYLLALPFEGENADADFWGVAVGAAFIGGFAGGSLLFALYLFVVHRIRGHRAPKHTNEVFAGQGIRGYKHLLRLHIDRQGQLTVHALGVKRICRRWEVEGSSAHPAFRPREEEPRVEQIEVWRFPRGSS